MDNLLHNNRFNPAIGNWDWQPLKLKKRFGQLTLSDVTLAFGKEDDMMTRIGMRLNKSRMQVIYLLQNLKHL